MALYKFKLPDIGEGIAEAEIVAWHVKVGDVIGEDQQIADMMTDKATVEMESPVAGKVVELAGEVGDQIPIGSVLAVIETEGADRAERNRRRQRGRAPARRWRGRGDPGAWPKKSRSRPATTRPRASPFREDVAAEATSHSTTRNAKAEPAGRAASRRAPGAGPRLPRRPRPRPRPRHRPWRRSTPPATASATPTSTPSCSTMAAASRRRGAAPRADETIKVVGLRRKIAENMQEAKRRIPHFALVEQFDVTALEETRAMMNRDRGANPKLTLLPFLITALVQGDGQMADAQRHL